MFEGDQNWRSLKSVEGEIFAWDETSTYIKRPPYFDAMVDPSAPIERSDGQCACSRCWAIR